MIHAAQKKKLQLKFQVRLRDLWTQPPRYVVTFWERWLNRKWKHNRLHPWSLSVGCLAIWPSKIHFSVMLCGSTDQLGFCESLGFLNNCKREPQVRNPGYPLRIHRWISNKLGKVCKADKGVEGEGYTSYTSFQGLAIHFVVGAGAKTIGVYSF